MRLNYKHTTLLLCCGAGAALAAIFKAPITGVVFVLEILMLDITAGSVIPLLIASITATTMAFMLRGFDPILAVTLQPQDAFELWQIPLFILLGVCCGLMSWYFTSTNLRVGNFFRKIDSQYKKWLVGGAVLGILIFIFPPLYGEGYEGFMSLMHGRAQELFDNSLFYRFREIDWVVILFVIATMFFKVIAMASTNAAGGVGGTFAAVVVRGGVHGSLDRPAVQCLLRLGRLGRLVHAGGHGRRDVGRDEGAADLDLPHRGAFERLRTVHPADDHGLHIVRRRLLPRPRLDLHQTTAPAGRLLTHDKDQSVFVFLKLDDLMETDFLRIKENFTLGDIVHIISTARRNIFPVIDNFGHLLGIVQLDDLREDMFKHEKYGQPISDYMIQPPDKILEHELIQGVMEKFEDKHTWMLPVVDKQNRYLGFISKSRILNAYREQLVKIQQ